MLSLLLLFAINLEQLQSNAGVASAKEVLPGTESRIIHIRDWHLVPKDDFAIDIGLKATELGDAYAEHLQDVERVQKSQIKISPASKRCSVKD